MKLKTLLLSLLLIPSLAAAQQTAAKKKRKVSRTTKQERVLKRRPPSKPTTLDSISGPVELSDTKTRPPPIPIEGQEPIAPPEPAIATRKPKLRDTRTSDHEFALGMVMWQESIKLKNGANEANMESQLKGVAIAYDLHSPKANSSWYWLLGLEVAAGTVKGKGEAPIQDQFDNQTWSMVGLRGGLIIKSSEVSRFGFAIPVAYRSVNWVYEPGSATKASEKKFSAGGQFIFENRLSERASLRVSMTRQHMWDAHLWAAALAVEF